MITARDACTQQRGDPSFSRFFTVWAWDVCCLHIFCVSTIPFRDRTIMLCHPFECSFTLLETGDRRREASHPCVLSWSNPGLWSAESAQISCCLSRFLDNPGEDNGQVCVAAWHCVIPAVVLGSLIDLMRCCSENCICMPPMLCCCSYWW